MAITPPEAADIVAVAIIPLQPVGRKFPELIAAGANIPGLGNHDAIAQKRILRDRRENGRLWIESGVSRQHGREIETESVDAATRKVAQGLQDQGMNSRVGCIQRVPGSGVIDQAAIGRLGIAAIVQSAQAQDRTGDIAFASVIQD